MSDELRTRRLRRLFDALQSGSVEASYQALNRVATQDADRVRAERDRLIVAANSARVLIERHRATRGSSHLLATALSELDDVLPTYQEDRGQ